MVVILEADGLTAGPRPVPAASRGDLWRGPLPSRCGSSTWIAQPPRRIGGVLTRLVAEPARARHG